MTANRETARGRTDQAVWPCEPLECAAGARLPSRITRSLVRFSLTFMAGTVLLIVFKHVWLGAILYVLSGLTLLGGLLIPQIENALQRLGEFLGRLAGAMLTYALLIPFFCLCFVSGRIVLFLLRKDVMCRRRTLSAQSYWVANRASADRQSYRRLY